MKIEFLVFVHVHYAQVWAEMAQELAEKIDVPFGLVLTYCRGGDAPCLPDTPCLRFSKLMEVENKGRDILPFIKALASDLPAVDIGLKLHTKRSPHRDDGADWRAFMCASLLSSDADGLTALRLMKREGRVGLIASEGHLLPLKGRLTFNRGHMNRMASAMWGTALPSDLDHHRFPAGSMFWFRPSALLPFTVDGLEQQFPRERGQLDGTAAHAAERLFAVAVERGGLLAAGMEAVMPLLGEIENRGEKSLSEMRSVVDTHAQATDNAFRVPLADLWHRYRGLSLLAQVAYVYLPRSVTFRLRALLRRWLV